MRVITMNILIRLISALLMTFAINSAVAQEHSHDQHHHNHHHNDQQNDDESGQQASKVTTATPLATNDKSCQQQLNIEVNGLVCDFCARALEKVFKANPAVDEILVDLQNGLVQVELVSEGALAEAKIEQMITDSGYNMVAVKAACING